MLRTWVVRAASAGAVALAATLPGVPAVQAQDAGALSDPAVAVADRFLSSLQAGEWAAAAALVSESVPAGRLGAADLEAVWGQIRAGAGELQGRTLHQVATVQDTLKSVEYMARFTAQALLVRVVITPGGRVTGFWLLPPPDGAAAAGETPPPSGAAEATSRTPDYADATRYREIDVELGEEGWRLRGTLTVPTSPGRHPVVVLVHGSGPHDRDESIGPNAPFRDLALGLSSHGVAVLRYDKRTRVHAARMTNVTVDAEVIDDALAALELVRSQASLDPSRVVLLGHSLGGQLGPEIARRDGRLAGLILLAAPSRDLADVIADQLAWLASLPQNQGGAAQEQLRTWRAQLDRYTSGLMEDDESLMGAPASYFRELARYDPVRTAQQISTPILVLHGERDYQVTLDDFRLWQTALAGRADTRLRLFPGLNHLFIHGEGRPDPAEYARPGHVAVDVVREIAAWIDTAVRPRH